MSIPAPRPTTRWIAETGGQRGPSYAAMMRQHVASGADVHGEARLLQRLLSQASPAPHRRVLEAGCGTGRVAIELARQGYDVVGVDVDPSMVTEGRVDAETAGVGVHWVVGDLLDVADLTAGHGPFGLVAAPGNVMVYLAPGTEPDVVAALASVLAPGGHLVVGFATDRGVSAEDYLRWCAAVGLTLVAHHATWDGDPVDVGDGPYAVLVHRR